MAMPKWNGQDYIGNRYDDYFVLYLHHRDSDILNESNWRSIIKDLDNHPHVSYIIVRSSHWAVGWVEQILIHPSNGGSVSYGNKIREKLESYPIFDEDDFLELESEKVHELLTDIRNDINNLEPGEKLTGWPHIDETMTDEQIGNIIYNYGMVE